MAIMNEQGVLAFIKNSNGKLISFEQLATHFQIPKNQTKRQIFSQFLYKLISEGKLLQIRDQYQLPAHMGLWRGHVSVHPKGFAFFIPDDDQLADLKIEDPDQLGAMNGDIVFARKKSGKTRISPPHDKYKGEIVQILKRAIHEIVGLFTNYEKFGLIKADDRRINSDIFVRREDFNGAVSGQKVVAHITVYPSSDQAIQAKISQILGHKDDPGIDILSIIHKHGLPIDFPDEGIKEAKCTPDRISEEEIKEQKRIDLRHKIILTIDGEDAKDLDDAVNIERLPNGNYLLGVHIADVGYYVTEGSQLDQEAYRRGCSVYLVDRVIPMLPHRLSNGICSLNPKVDRLTLSCEMEFESQTLHRVRYNLFPSIIKTTERMTYTDVRKILQKEDPNITQKYLNLKDTFELMEELAVKLRDKRMRRGAIDFDFQESKVVVDELGKPTEIIKRERSIAEQIIEEFMLSANETVAEHFHFLNIPFLYRIHEEPSDEKLFTFLQFASQLGYTIQKAKNNKIHPRALQTLLTKIHGKKEETVISTMMLRSLKQAKYAPDNYGHFGLAADYYTHFTSPIRRYPDLVIHRIIHEVLAQQGSLSQKRKEELKVLLDEIAKQSSELERKAVDAERDTLKLKKAEYMLDKIGHEFTGMISGVTGFGLFVELDNSVEGLISLSELKDDFYAFDRQRMILVGERTARVFRIGDEVKVRVARVNMDEYRIEFVLAEPMQRKPKAGHTPILQTHKKNKMKARKSRKSSLPAFCGGKRKRS